MDKLAGFCLIALCLNFVQAEFRNASRSPVALGVMPIGGPCDQSTDCVGTAGVSSECDKSFETCKCRDGHVAQNNLMDCLEKRHDVEEQCKEPQQCQMGNLAELSDCIDFACHCKDTAVKDPAISRCLVKLKLVGEQCQSSLQCSANLGVNSVCSTICMCENSVAKSDNTRCLPLLQKIGEICEETPQCTLGIPGHNSECKSSTCSCIQGSVKPEVGETCLPEAGYGEPCSDNQQCKATLGTLAACSATETVCRCVDGQSVPNADNTACLQLANQIGGSCQVDEQCQQGTPGIYSSCVDGQCKCSMEAVQVTGENQCHKKAEHVEEPCNFHEQCTANLGDISECKIGVCVCSEGAVATTNKKKCLPGPVPIGKPCQDTNQCVSNAECTATGQCGCKPDFVPNGLFDQCLPIQPIIGGTCEEPVQCQHGIPGHLSDCLLQNFTGIPEAVCNCTNQAVARPGYNECHKKASIVGDPCQFNQQCSVPLGLGLCFNESCVCSAEANPSSNRTKCLKKAELGQVCEDDGQCSHISELNSASCQQPDDSTVLNPKRCICKAGHLQQGNKCLKLAGIVGDECTTQIQCTNLKGTKCRLIGDKLGCFCDPDEIANQNQDACLPLVSDLNGICQETNQCLVPHTECLLHPDSRVKQCQCNGKTFIESLKAPGTCTEIAQKLNQPCAEDIQCSTGLGERTECRDLKCLCKAVYREHDGDCYNPVALGRRCTEDGECITGVNNYTKCSSSLAGVCECIPDAVLSEASCWDDKRIGDECQNDDQCRVSVLGDVRCSRGLCSCATGLVAELDNRLCTSTGSHFWSASLLILSMFVFSLFSTL